MKSFSDTIEFDRVTPEMSSLFLEKKQGNGLKKFFRLTEEGSKHPREIPGALTASD